MTTEAEIRDYLIEHLDLIEPGLRLIEKEFKLPNPDGAKGFIDILARDRLGHLVVVELKRSDQAARAAIHELHKYVALLRAAHGVEAHRLRCMVCSTHWHELLVPFSEYARSVDYAVEGRSIELSPKGVPIVLKSVSLLAEPQAARFCPHHVILLFEEGNTGRQEEAAALTAKNLRDLGVDDFAIALLSSVSRGEGSATHVVYVAVSELSPDQKSRLASTLDLTNDDASEEESDESDDVRWRWEDAVIERATIELSRDQFEIGYPEKFAQILSNGWRVDAIHRGGRLRSALLIPDAQLVAALGGVNGDNHLFYTCVASPKFGASWRSAVTGADRCLTGNPEFAAGFRWFMRQTEAEYPNATVSGYVFNPLNIVLGLWKWVTENDPLSLPEMELFRDARAKEPCVAVRAFVGWDGVTFPKDPESILRECANAEFRSDVDDAYFIATMFQEAWLLEPAVMKRNGLVYALDQATLVDGKLSKVQRVVLSNEGASLHDPKDRPLQPLAAFVRENEAYVTELCALLERNILRLRRPPTTT